MPQMVTPLWPCFGYGGTGTDANPDCPYLGDSSWNGTESLPGGRSGSRHPAIRMAPECRLAYPDLQAFGCDGSTTADAGAYCGEVDTWYEDWTGDSTDELTYLVEATQGTTVVSDSGTVDFGPNTLRRIYSCRRCHHLRPPELRYPGYEPAPTTATARLTSTTPSRPRNMRPSPHRRDWHNRHCLRRSNSFAAGDYVFIFPGQPTPTTTLVPWLLRSNEQRDCDALQVQRRSASGLGTATAVSGVLYYDGTTCARPTSRSSPQPRRLAAIRSPAPLSSAP